MSLEDNYAKLERKVAHAATVLRLIHDHHGHAFSAELREKIKAVTIDQYVHVREHEALKEKLIAACNEIAAKSNERLAAEITVANLSQSYDDMANVARQAKEQLRLAGDIVAQLRKEVAQLQERLKLAQHNLCEAARVAGECEREEAAKVAASWQPKGVGGTRAIEMAMAPRLIAEAIRARKSKV